MEKKKYILLTLILSLLSIDSVYAGCSEAAKREFKEIEEQYKIIKTYNSENKTYTIRIEEGNPQKFAYAIPIEYNYENYKKINDKVYEISGLKSGQTFYVSIMGKTSQCDDQVRADQIKLSRSNEYYGDPLCEGIEDFVLCQETYDNEIDRETFESRVELYKKNQNEEKKEIEKEEQKQKNDIIDEITAYIKNNIIELTIVFIFIVLIVITSIVTIKMTKKSRRLE